jgi:hypothetical protein
LKSITVCSGDAWVDAKKIERRKYIDTILAGNFRRSGGVMRRVLIAAAIATAVLAATCTNVFAATVQFPKNSAVAFTVQVPAGWTTSDDGKGNLTLSAAGQPLGVSLTVLDNAAAISQLSVAEFAQAVLKPTNAAPIYKQVPATVAGVDGTTFFASSQDGNGNTVDLKLTVLFVNGRYVVMETVGTPTVMTPALETALKSVMKGIALKITK